MNQRWVMFRMNGISRVSTWMCGAIVSVLHASITYGAGNLLPFWML